MKITPDEEDYYRKQNELIDNWKIRGIPIAHGCLADEGRRFGPVKHTKLLAYRRKHPSKVLLSELSRWLNQRTKETFPKSEDLVVNPADSPSWMRKEVYLRMVCLMFLESMDEAVWHRQRVKPGSDPELRGEGWLLVEEQRIVGAAVFNRVLWTASENQEPDYQWVLSGLFIDPEHRRKGCTKKRIPKWVERYGNFMVDHPNPEAWALITEMGYSERLRVIDTSPQNLGFDVVIMPVGYDLEAFYDQIEVEIHQEMAKNGHFQ